MVAKAKKAEEQTALAPDISPEELARGALLGVPQAINIEPSCFPEIPDVKRRAYLVAYSITASFDQAAKAAGVDRKTGYNWRHDQQDSNKPFLAAMETGRALACEAMEAEIKRRGFSGVEEPVYQGGKLVGTKRKFSDVLAIFYLKGAMPDKYREQHEHVGAGGGPIQLAPVDLSRLSEEELKKARALALKAQNGAGPLDDEG